MYIKKLNKSSNVFQRGQALWSAEFHTPRAYAQAIEKMIGAFGMGAPFTNFKPDDSGHEWMFRNASMKGTEMHRLYLTEEAQITLLGFSFGPDD